MRRNRSETDLVENFFEELKAKVGARANNCAISDAERVRISGLRCAPFDVCSSPGSSPMRSVACPSRGCRRAASTIANASRIHPAPQDLRLGNQFVVLIHLEVEFSVRALIAS